MAKEKKEPKYNPMQTPNTITDHENKTGLGYTIGNQFGKGNTAAKKWTEEKALQVGNELIEWLRADETNIFVNDFLVLENNYYSELIAYLKGLYPSFLKLLKTAHEIQELKLTKGATFNVLNTQMAKWVLAVHHNKREVVETKNTNVNLNKDLDNVGELSDDDINKRIKELSNRNE